MAMRSSLSGSTAQQGHHAHPGPREHHCGIILLELAQNAALRSALKATNRFISPYAARSPEARRHGARPSGQYLTVTGYLPQRPNLKLRPAFTTFLVALMSRIPPLLKVISRLPKS
jgi:hypothetical protein